MDQHAFETLLGSMTAADNATRKSAEEQYDQLSKNDPLWLMHAVTEICATTTSEAVLSISIILLRKMFASSVDCYDKATPEVREAIKGRMLEIFANNAANKNARSAAACISALAAKVVAIGDDYSSLWQNLFATLSSPQAPSAHRGACCEVIAHTATVLASTFLKNHLAELSAGLDKCFYDPSTDVKRSAFAAVQAVAQVVDKADLHHFRPLVNSMLSTVAAALNSQDWEAATSLCAALSDCIEHNADLFSSNTAEVLQAMMQVASSPQVSSEARHMAVEVMVTYCDTEPKAVRKVHGFSKALFELLFNYMLHPEMPDDWDVTYDDENADLEGVSDLDIGCTSLDRVATAIRAKTLQEIAQTLFMQNIHSESWQHRNAALILLTYVSEGLQTVFAEQLGQILQFVIPMCRDPHKFVRHSAVTCLSQFCNDFAPQIQTEFHAVVVPPLKEALHDVPRIASAAAGGLNSFFDNAEDGDDDDRSVMNRLSPYVHGCCLDLVQVFNSSTLLFVKGDCLGALSAIIGTCKEALTPYVNDLVPIFQGVLQLQDDASTDAGKAIRKMKCTALECTTLLACGVGRENFSQYSHAVCQYLQGMLGQGLSNDDPQLRYVLRGWTCMVECLKEEVLPYMHDVLPQLLRVANLDCDVEIVQNEVGDDDDSDDDDDKVQKVKLCIPGLGEQTVKVHTALIEDKELASNIILSILTELKGKLAPYLLPITEMACDLLSFSATGAVRENGAEILALLGESYKEGAPDHLVPFLHHVFPRILAAAKDESDMSVLGDLVTTLSKLLDVTPPQSLSDQVVHDIATRVHTILADSVTRRTKVIEEKKRAGNDEEDLDALEDDDDTEQFLLSECNSAIGALLRNCTQQFLPVFVESYLSSVATLTGNAMDDYDVKTGLSILCDFVEYAGDASLAHLPNIASAFLHFATRANEMVAQASFYGLGLLLTLVHSKIPQPHAESVHLATETVNRVSAYLGSAHAKEVDYLDCTCNVVSTSIKALDTFGQAGAFDAVKLVQQVLNVLPVDGDEVEAARVHERLTHWVVHGHWIFASIPTAQKMIRDKLRSAKAENLNDATKALLAAL